MKHYLLGTLLLIVMIACGSTHAVTLGQAHVHSFLGESLDAEIDLIGMLPGQHQELRLRIANDRHFERLGITHTRFLSALTFDVVQSGNRWIVRARSSRPVTEPFLDFPLQMSWPDGRLIKQYTLLLDPPQRIRPARTTRGKLPTPMRTTAQAQSNTDRSAYGPVQPGETLWPIAQKLKPSGITTRQMAMALLRANPAAFINGNINKLRAGVTLTIPQRVFIEELDANTARAEFSAQTRRRQAPVATSPRVTEAPATALPMPAPSTSPESVTDAQPSAEQQEANAQLRILTDPDRAEPNAKAGSQQGLQEQLLVTMEEIESNRITTGAIETRLARMEAELDRMRQLVELKDAQIAALQSDVAAKEAIQAAARIAEPPPPAPATTATPASPPAAKHAPAPTPVARIESVPMAIAPPPARPWYEEYVWVLWIILGLMGLAALLMLVRRPQPHLEDASAAELPEIKSASRPSVQAADTPPSDELQEAEEDFRRLADQHFPVAESSTEPEQELPELEVPRAKEANDSIDSDITDSLLDEVLDGNQSLTSQPASDSGHTEFSDDDIASWVAELGTEAEQVDVPSANDERIPMDDDIPSILTELDDQLSGDRSPPAAAEIQIEPADETREDDTFSMSLDLARAYLEIGDQEGARDMLQQALAGARDPEHRRQIEELLTQID